MEIMIVIVKIDENNDIYLGVMWEFFIGFLVRFLNIFLKDVFKIIVIKWNVKVRIYFE